MDYYQVEDLTPLTIRSRIKSVMAEICKRRLKIFVRKSPNLVYLPRLDRVCMKKYEDLIASNLSVKNTVRMIFLFKIIARLSKENEKYLCKYGVYYENKKLFVSPTISDKLIDEACCLLGATRRSLKIKGVSTGKVIGSITIKEKGKIFNLFDFDSLGRSISPYMPDFDIVSCDAKFIMVIEKEVTYSNLIHDNFHKKVSCIMITGSGMPDVSTRFFLRHLTKKLKKPLPIVGLFDWDPHGVEILSTYRCGSRTLAFDAENLATPNIMWLGIRSTDWATYNLKIGKNPLTPHETDLILKIKTWDSVRNKPCWENELDTMLGSGEKIDLCALNCKMVLKKLANEDWLS